MTKIFYQYYNKETLSDIAKYLIKSKNYDELRILSSSHKLNSFIGLDKAIQYLDNDSISIILKNTKFDEPNKKEAALISISISHFKEHLEYEHVKINKLAKYIFKTQLENKVSLDKISNSIISKLAILDLKELVDKFYKEKTLTATDLEHLKKTVENFTLVLKETNTHFLSSEDICVNSQFAPILSRTYSDTINKEQAYQLYKSVYDSGKHGKAIIDFLNERSMGQDPWYHYRA